MVLVGNMIRSTISSDVTNNEVDLFVNALDYDATGAVHFNDLLKFFLKGLNLNQTKRMQFASRSEFHGKLNLFMEYPVHFGQGSGNGKGTTVVIVEFWKYLGYMYR